MGAHVRDLGIVQLTGWVQEEIPARQIGQQGIPGRPLEIVLGPIFINCNIKVLAFGENQGVGQEVQNATQLLGGQLRLVRFYQRQVVRVNTRRFQAREQIIPALFRT